MKRTFSVNMDGNGALDMLLFSPLALLFLFVISDGGLVLIERGVIADALRSGMHAQGLFLQDRSAFVLSDDYQIEVHTQVLQELLEGLSQEVLSKLKRAGGSLPNPDKGRFAVEVSALLVPMDPADGSIDYTEHPQIIASSLIPRAGVEASSANVPGYPYVSKDEFIKGQLDAEREKRPSSYAVPLGLIYHLAPQASVDFRYMNHALLIYAEVRAVAQGINQGYSKSVLGRLYAVQEQQLQLVRMQI